MRIAIITVGVFGVAVGLIWPGLNKPEVPRPTPADVVREPLQAEAITASPSELKAAFQSLEDTRSQVAKQRAFIEFYSNWAPYEATRCFRLLNEIDLLIAKIQNRVIRASNGESVPPIPEDIKQLQHLTEQFNKAGSDFKQAASPQARNTN